MLNIKANITVEDEFDLAQDDLDLTEDVSNRNRIVNTIKTFNFTNVKKQRGGSGGGANQQRKQASSKNDKDQQQQDQQQQAQKPKKPKKPMPWDIENVSLSYAFTQVEYRDPIISSEVSKDYRVGLDYTYSRRGGYIEPFKFIKTKSLGLISNFNINPLPNSFSFSSNINRYVSVRRFRIPQTPIFEFDDRRFEWERRYDLTWNLTKSIKMNFSALNESYVDELRQR